MIGHDHLTDEQLQHLEHDITEFAAAISAPLSPATIAVAAIDFAVAEGYLVVPDEGGTE